MNFKRLGLNEADFLVKQADEIQEADKNTPLEELKQLILTAFELQQLPTEEDKKLNIQGQGVHFVHLDSGQEVLLQYHVSQESQHCKVAMQVKIDGKDVPVKEVVQLYSKLRKEGY